MQAFLTKTHWALQILSSSLITLFLMFATMESEGTDMPSDVAPLFEGHTIREVDELADLPGLGEDSDSEF